RERFARVRSLEGEPEARRALWEAEHLLDLGSLDDARRIAERVAASCEALAWEGHVAHASTVLGTLSLRETRPDVRSAREHVTRARRWADSSGEVEVVLRVRVLAARIALAEGAPDVATREAGEGRQLAESCGFVLAGARLGLLAAEAALTRGETKNALALAEGA